MNKVPVPLFVLWCIALIGIVVCFGFMDGAYTVNGYHVWKIAGIACCVLFVSGIVWYFAKGNNS